MHTCIYTYIYTHRCLHVHIDTIHIYLLYQSAAPSSEPPVAVRAATACRSSKSQIYIYTHILHISISTYTYMYIYTYIYTLFICMCRNKKKLYPIRCPFQRAARCRQRRDRLPFIEGLYIYIHTHAHVYTNTYICKYTYRDRVNPIHIYTHTSIYKYIHT